MLFPDYRLIARAQELAGMEVHELNQILTVYLAAAAIGNVVMYLYGERVLRAFALARSLGKPESLRAIRDRIPFSPQRAEVEETETEKGRERASTEHGAKEQEAALPAPRSLLLALCALVPLWFNSAPAATLQCSPVPGATRYTFYMTVKLGDSATPFFDVGPVPTNAVSYGLSASNALGESAPAEYAIGTPNPVNVVLTTDSPPPIVNSATFVRLDSSTQGNWPGVYGSAGYTIAGDATKFAPASTLALSGQLGPWTWTNSTPDARALLRGGTGNLPVIGGNLPPRLAAAWYSPSAFTIDLSFTDTSLHRVAFYCIDWDLLGRVQTVEFFDGSTGKSLESRSMSQFTGGAWLVYDLSGHVQVRFTRGQSASGANAVLSGIFFQ